MFCFQVAHLHPGTSIYGWHRETLKQSISFLNPRVQKPSHICGVNRNTSFLLLGFIYFWQKEITLYLYHLL